MQRSLLRTTVPFATVHLEIFHCTHHPVIPNSDLYFTYCKVTVNGLMALENGMSPSTPLNGCEINVRFSFA